MNRFPSEALAGAAHSRELTELKAYELIDGPIGPERGDRRAAAMALAAGGGKLADVAALLEFSQPEEHTLIEATPEEIAANAERVQQKFMGIVGGPSDGDDR